MPRTGIALPIVLLALMTARCGVTALVSRVGDMTGQGISRIAEALRVPAESTDSLEAEVFAEPGPAIDDTPRAAEPPPVMRPRVRAARAGERAVRAEPRADERDKRAAENALATGALEVPAERVARLSEQQLRSLRAVDSVDGDGHAMGAKLYGVSALGVGLADGDVVTRIDGRETPDVSTALAAAMRAVASGQCVARATVLRGSRTLRVTIQIPRGAGRAGTP